WEEEIAERVENCSIFIYMITRDSLESNNCKDELALARDLEKNFINILTDGKIELPSWFRLRYKRYQMCNYFSFSSPEAAVEDLKRRSKWFDIVKADINGGDETGPETAEDGRDPAENDINGSGETVSEKAINDDPPLKNDISAGKEEIKTEETGAVKSDNNGGDKTEPKEKVADRSPANANTEADEVEIKQKLATVLKKVSESAAEGAQNNAVSGEKNEKTASGARLQKGDIIKFGRYIQQKGGSPEPIEWLVLDVKEEKALLISKYALDCMPYNTSVTAVAQWENSLIRRWIKTTFLQAAFNREERERIQYTALKTSTVGDKGYDTTDKVFLLSLDAWHKYLPFELKKCEATPYCYEKGALKQAGKCNWWLRSRCIFSDSSVAYVDFAGSAHDWFGATPVCKKYAVRPAMWIKL
ncbi:MAG: hypothetical protein IKX78_05495, partial [Clostridia bacterium]|nr:hypothetical protein [Clostridia bacterium]